VEKRTWRVERRSSRKTSDIFRLQQKEWKKPPIEKELRGKEESEEGLVKHKRVSNIVKGRGPEREKKLISLRRKLFEGSWEDQEKEGIVRDPHRK